MYHLQSFVLYDILDDASIINNEKIAIPSLAKIG